MAGIPDVRAKGDPIRARGQCLAWNGAADKLVRGLPSSITCSIRGILVSRHEITRPLPPLLNSNRMNGLADVPCWIVPRRHALRSRESIKVASPMSDLTAVQLAQRVVDMGLIEPREMEAVWSDLGTRDIPVDDLCSHLQRRELLTNWQTERLLEGRRAGYFYGPYKMLYLVGAGTFARVYRAVHRETGDVFAVKVLRQRYSEDMTKTEQFLREASVVIPLRHQNIVQIHDVKSERGRYYMVMEFVEGQNLRDFVKVQKKLSVEKALGIISDIVAGMDYAFNRGITHRDMKLSNVLLSSRGRAELVDFGLAAHEGKLDDDSLQNVSNARSIDYAALERATHVRKDDKRSDIYFAGCMFYHMLTGESPLLETRDRIQRLNVSRFNDVVPIGEREPTLPVRIRQIVEKAMSMKVEDRYQTPAEMLADLKDAKNTLTDKDSQVAPDSKELSPNKGPAQATSQQLEGTGFTVMLVESNAKVQDLLRDRLKKLGYRVLVIGNPQRALSRFEYGERAADCVIFGASQLGAEALDAFNQFVTADLTKDVSAILLVDKKQIPWLKNAHTDEHHIVVNMPLKFGQFRASLRGLVMASSLKADG